MSTQTQAIVPAPQLPLPADPQAERLVIGAIVFDPPALADIRDLLPDAGVFTDEHMAAIYSAALALDDSGRPIDAVTLRNELRRQKLTQDDTTERLLAEIIREAFTSTTALYHATQVRERAIVRGVISLCARVQRAAAEGDDAGAVIDALTVGAAAIAERGFLDRGKLIGPLVDAVIAEATAYQGEGVIGLRTGFPELDTKIGGLKKKHLIGVGGAGKIGKTAFGVDIATAVGLSQRKPVAVISYEMSAEELAERFVVSASRIPIARIREAKLSADERSRLDQIHAALRESRIVIDDAAPVTIHGLRARLRMHKRVHRIELAVVDYFQLMTGSDAKARRYDQLVEVSRGLKLLANELDIPIVILAQLNAEGMAAERTPRVTDIEECKRLFKDANVFILLDRPYERQKNAPGQASLPDPTHGTIDVAAIRSGESGPIHAHYVGAIQRWTTDGQQEEQVGMDWEVAP